MRKRPGGLSGKWVWAFAWFLEHHISSLQRIIGIQGMIWKWYKALLDLINLLFHKRENLISFSKQSPSWFPPATSGSFHRSSRSRSALPWWLTRFGLLTLLSTLPYPSWPWPRDLLLRLRFHFCGCRTLHLEFRHSLLAEKLSGTQGSGEIGHLGVAAMGWKAGSFTVSERLNYRGRGILFLGVELWRVEKEGEHIRNLSSLPAHRTLEVLNEAIPLE